MRTAPRRLALLVLVALAAACSPSHKPPVTATPSSSAPATSAAPTPTADPAARAARVAAGLSDDELVGQVLMPAVNLDDPAQSAAQLVRDNHLGGVILMGAAEGANVAASVRALTDALQAAGTVNGAPLLIGTDQEYGWVTRIRSGIVQLPSAMAFGAAGNADLTEAAWAGAGAELSALGINVDFAPDADVIGSSGNTIIGSRSFGGDPAAVSAQVAAAVRGLEGAGVAATVKHFPGHGHTTVDSHQALPVLTQSRAALASGDLPPFKAGIVAGVSLVMAGHLDVRAIDPTLPASFSRKVLTDLLRGEMGFKGVVVTDALNMAPAKRWSAGEAAVRALVAGSDLLLMPADLGAARRGLLEGLRNRSLPRPRLVEAVTRLLTLRFRLAAVAHPAASTVNTAQHATAASAVAAAAVTVLRGPCSGALVPGALRITAGADRRTQVGWLTDALRRLGVPVVASGGSEVRLVGYGDGTADLSATAAITVAMDTPYLLARAASPVRVATYSSSKVSMDALAAVLAGRAAAPGRSPVPVSGLPRSACAAH